MHPSFVLNVYKPYCGWLYRAIILSDLGLIKGPSPTWKQAKLSNIQTRQIQVFVIFEENAFNLTCDLGFNCNNASA